ncbi:MAG: hypothetical protein NW206_03565 [Hyphomonadaceae bacterium]|nr:hypothetical protein [Hyphomonadaceae bacterium]
MSADAPPPTIQRHKAKWREVVLVCRKCTKKVRGGFGKKQRTSLRKALREELDLPKGRRSPIGVIEVGCFDLCPKKAVTVYSSAQPEALYAVSPGTPLSEVIETLGLSAASGGPDIASEQPAL